MIKRIELKNFMSHEHTVIEPAAGLTVLIGPNNVGKSAIIAALQILCYNENSTYVMRHGTKECSVTVETDDDHTIQWKRKKSPSYLIDGEKFDRLARNGVPEELHQTLRMPKVEASSGDAFDIHFGSQKTPIFLLDQSGATAARFFASSSDAIRLVAMQQKHKEKVRDARRQRIQLDKESEQLNTELAALEPIVAIEKRVETLEKHYQNIEQSTAQLKDLQQLESVLAEQTDAVSLLAAENKALNSLTSPPELISIDPISTSITQIIHWENRRANAVQLLHSLKPLASPPQLAETDPILTVVQKLIELESEITIGQIQHTTLQPFAEPPTLADDVSLEHLVNNLAISSEEFLTTKTTIETLQSLRLPPQLENLEELNSLISNLTEGENEKLKLFSEATLLEDLKTLEIESDVELCELVERLSDANHRVKQLQTAVSLLDQIPSPHVADDVILLDNSLVELIKIDAQVAQCQDEADRFAAELAEVKELIRLAAEDENCPVCGGPLNPEKLLEQAGRLTG